jgi:hypothetical protein
MIFFYITAFIFSFSHCKAQQNPCPKVGDNLFISLFNEKTNKIIDDLGFMLSIISDKTTETLEANSAIDNAVKLFIDGNAIVQLSKVRDTTYQKTFKIREYLKLVKALKFNHIDIEWITFQYLCDLCLGDDGNYHGISYHPKFKKIKNELIKYGNLTKNKTPEIVKSIQMADSSGKTIIIFDSLIKISSIGVSLTYK